MSKGINWQIFFASRTKKFRIDIYKENARTNPIQLLAGETPFVTNEDASDNFFCPIRPQSGTISVCTKIERQGAYPLGGTLQLEDIIPANNIDRPVKVWNITSESSPYLEWQGFLSCEVYSQEYTNLSQNIDLPVISVLEALDSVPLNVSNIGGLQKIRNIVYNAFHEIDNQVGSGIEFFKNIYFSTCDYRIWDRYVDYQVFAEIKERINNNQIEYQAVGMSCKKVLEIFATYMGWCIREHRSTIIFQRLSDTGYNYYTQTVAAFNNGTTPRTSLPTSEQGIDTKFSNQWGGTDHRRSILQGAKLVEVDANIGDSDFGIQLPAFPFGDASSLEWIRTKYKSDEFQYFRSQINYNNNAYNNIAYAYYGGSLERTGDYQYIAGTPYVSTKADFLSKTALFPQQGGVHYLAANPLAAGAILMRYAIEEVEDASELSVNPDLKTGLYCMLLPGVAGQYLPIFSMKTPKKYSFSNGYFNINANMLFYALNRYNSADQPILSDSISDSYIDCDGEKITLALKVGNNYWDGVNTWTNTRSTFQVEMHNGGINLNIPVNTYLSGDVTIEVMAGVTVTHVNTLYQVIFNSLDVNFKYNGAYMQRDSSENKYMKVLSTNFRDEISISTEIASDMKNKPSPSIIMVGSTTPMETLLYDDSSIGTKRPELDLLSRLEEYYSELRQNLELIVSPNLVQASPALSLQIWRDINYNQNRKRYLPLSHSRDWQLNRFTMTAFEVY